MNDGLIMDTIIHGIASVVVSLPKSLTVVGMVFTQSIINFIVPSGSGQTLLTMPILTPIADMTGVTRQVAVLCLQFGDGLSNIFYPTVGYFMATLSIVKVPYQKYVKFIWLLMLIWLAIGIAFCMIAQSIGLGPF